MVFNKRASLTTTICGFSTCLTRFQLICHTDFTLAISYAVLLLVAVKLGPPRAMFAQGPRSSKHTPARFGTLLMHNLKAANPVDL